MLSPRPSSKAAPSTWKEAVAEPQMKSGGKCARPGFPATARSPDASLEPWNPIKILRPAAPGPGSTLYLGGPKRFETPGNRSVYRQACRAGRTEGPRCGTPVKETSGKTIGAERQVPGGRTREGIFPLLRRWESE